MNDKGDCRTAPATPGLLMTTKLMPNIKKYLYLYHVQESFVLWRYFKEQVGHVIVVFDFLLVLTVLFVVDGT